MPDVRRPSAGNSRKRANRPRREAHPSKVVPTWRRVRDNTPRRLPAAPATAAAGPTAFLALTSDVDFDGAALEIVTVQLLDRLLRLAVGPHLDETESARLACFTIRDDRRGFTGPCLRKELLQLLLAHAECEIAYVKLCAHGKTPAGCLPSR